MEGEIGAKKLVIYLNTAHVTKFKKTCRYTSPLPRS